MLRSKSKDRSSSGAETGMYMNKRQMGDYLHDLRNNRPARPAGARPPPPSSFVSKRYSTSNLSTITTGGATSVAERVKQVEDVPARCASAQSFHRKSSAMGEMAGRPLARPPVEEASVQEEGEDELPYLERGQRWLERQEAHSLRRALEDMDVKDEKKVFEDAQDEAAELVWKHQNPNAPFRNPDAPYKNPDLPLPAGYREHLRKGSTHARTASWAQTAQDIQAKQMKRRSRDSSASRSISGASKGSSGSAPSSRVPSDGSLKVPESPTTPLEEDLVAEAEREPRKRAVQFVEPTNEAAIPPEPHSNGLRKFIRNRTPSPSKALQAMGIGHKEDSKPKETPTENVEARVSSISAVPAHFRNPFSRARESKGKLSRVNTEPTPVTKRFDRFEIQRNPPSQSRNPLYTTNSASDESRSTTPDQSVKMKDGKEIRGDDIRKATSASLRDRSQKLPTPTMVSDSPGRPIVSFQKGWKPKEVELKQEISPVKIVPIAKPAEPEACDKPVPSAEKPLPVLRKKVPGSSAGASMQLPSRERERVSPPPAPLVHAATEPIVPTLNHGIMPPIPTIAVSSAPPIPRIAVNDAPPLPRIAVNDAQPVPRIAVNDVPSQAPQNAVNDLPASLRIGVNSGRPGSRGSSYDSRPLPSHTQSHNSRPLPAIAGNGDNSVPTISLNSASAVPDAIPSIAVSAPSISVSEPPARGSSTRPLPMPTKGRPGPRHAASAPPGSNFLHNSHITPTGSFHPRSTGALCSTCALPIAGRIVTAAGTRFHPECFRCHHCGEGLECVAFYPEPESHRLDRVNRIRDRMTGYEDVPGSPEEDGDEGLRFYCHLDYHEFFSPRCKSCKTPIEGEVVVACGAEWHVGHFFCAQCGDPFDDKTPFVEKDGYAWCVNCHTHRYSTKCKKCRKPVTDTVVRALEAEWHEQCFCCTECNGRFEDGRYFIRPGGMDPYCPACEERRLKA